MEEYMVLIMIIGGLGAINFFGGIYFFILRPISQERKVDRIVAQRQRQ